MNKFATLSPEKLENHLNDYLISHWSASAVMTFITNEKAFEKKYIFKDYPKQDGLAAIIGKVYHQTLMAYFKSYQLMGEKYSFDQLTEIAHEYLNDIGADKYKPQAKKTIEQLQLDALAAVNALITNFLAESDSYLNEIQEILLVEEPLMEFVVINGIDIPLPLKAVPDLVFIDKQGRLAVLDHKSKYSYTSEGDVNLRYGNQSVSYILAVNSWITKQSGIIIKHPGVALGVQRFFYYENKYSQNRDRSRQIRQISIDVQESQQLYEQILFEAVWRVIEAVQNPDYVYLMNPNDHFEDGEDIINFWVKTHLEGLEGFPNLNPNQITLLKKKRQSIRSASLVGVPKNIIKAFSNPKEFVSLTPEQMETMTPSQLIEHRLATFNYPVKVAHMVPGYSCDTYLLQVNAGLKVNTIFGYRMDIANAIGVSDVRICPSLISYQNGVYIGVEVNRQDSRSLILTNGDVATDGFKFPLGKDNFSNTLSWDIGNPSTPHLMISGASGSGKSVTIKTIIEVARQKGVRVTILDPKNEFDEYSDSFQVISDLKEIEEFMEYTVMEMDEIFKTQGAKNKSEKRLIIFDESADCYARQTLKRFTVTMNASGKKVKNQDFDFKTLQENTLILAQKARSAGIHLILAAQRFSVKVLTGDAKANFTTRLCMKVASGIDSKVMLDQEGAEKLKGKGDALLVSPEHSQPVRIQCFINQS